MISKQLRRQAWARFALWMALYVVLVLVVSTLFDAGLIPRRLLVPAALLPMVPAVLAAFASMDRIRALDEMQRKIQADGILFSWVITAVVTLSYGFLEVYAGAPRLSMFAVWPLIAGPACRTRLVSSRTRRTARREPPDDQRA